MRKSYKYIFNYLAKKITLERNIKKKWRICNKNNKK